MMQKKTRLSGINRRKFLKTGGALSVMLGAGYYTGAAPSVGRPEHRHAGKAKNIIFLVSDGMSNGTLSTTDQFLLWKERRTSHWTNLMIENRCVNGLMDMSSLNSIVTDSGAAASSWGCGQRVNNGSINMDPDGNALKPILKIAKDAGKSAGLVTTATATHATPAGFAANLESRRDQRAIADQYYERGYDVILGGGERYFGERRNRPILKDSFKEQGYAYLEKRGDLLSLNARDATKVLGLFSHVHIPYEIDRLNNETLKRDVPSLAEMTTVALQALANNDEGFVVQVEGARVDHAAHRNDMGGLIYDQIAFDDAVKVALDFQEHHPETLVIITTDHGNASPGLSSGINGGQSNFEAFAGFRSSFESIQLEAEASQGEVEALFKTSFGVDISKEEIEMIREFLQENYKLPYRRMNRRDALLGQILANYTDFGWIGNTHTAEYVHLSAIGPGSDQIKPLIRNTDLFNLMVDSAGMQAWRT